MSPADREVIMSVPDSSATPFSEQIFLQMMRQQTQALDTIGRAMERIAEKQSDMGERLASLEALPVSTLHIELEQMESRLNVRLQTLETRNTEVDGVRKFIDWLRTTAPWIAAMILGGIAYFNKPHS